MTIPGTALETAPQIAIRMFASSSNFYLDITSRKALEKNLWGL